MPKPEEFDNITHCPQCKEDLRAEPIPKRLREHYGSHTHYSKLIGIEFPELYDGVSFWQCPFCKTVWDRWTGRKLTAKEYARICKREEKRS